MTTLFIVTGTTNGIGKELARAIAAQPVDRLVTLSRAADAHAANATNFSIDLADAAAIAELLPRVDAALADARVERAVLINNAGVLPPVGPLQTLDPSALAAGLTVNLLAPMLLMRWFIASVLPRAASGAIINISSGAARRPIQGWSAYCSAKAGLDMATRVVADEAAARGLRLVATSLAPGIVDTNMQGVIRSVTAEAFPDVEQFRAYKAEGALASPPAIAARILALDAAGRLPAGLADLRQLND